MQAKTVIPSFLSSAWQEQTFEYFREGIEICTLHAPAQTITSPDAIVESQPVIALLRYQAGARVPRHRHPGIETIVVLQGSQSDEDGCYETGSLVINPVGSEHSVWSEQGCVVLIQWDKPVQFV